jgi:hypothetical protein
MVARPEGGRGKAGSPVVAQSFWLLFGLFAQAFPHSLNLLLLDNSGAHTAQRLIIPPNVHLVFLPPYCSDLNPIERV